jgi:orotate phosphoribosyltransferase
MIKDEVAEILLKLKAVSIDTENPYTWASGIKSPIYCDNRIIISHHQERKIVAQAFAKLIKEKYPQTHCIAGTATAGIPHAAWVADLLQLPMIYVRSSAKEHGRGNQIEGEILEQANVVLIEDLFSTGMSSIAACQVIQAAKMNLLSVYSIFTYDLKKCKTNFLNHHINFHSLSDIYSLMKIAINKKIIKPEQTEIINHFLQELDR